MARNLSPEVVRQLTQQHPKAVLLVVVGSTVYRRGTDNRSALRRCPAFFPLAELPRFRMALEAPPDRVVKGNPVKAFPVVVVRLAPEVAAPARPRGPKRRPAGCAFHKGRSRGSRVIRNPAPFS